MNAGRETVLQFGAGRFLRAFVDRFIQQANDAGQNVGRVVVVQSTPGSRAEVLQQSSAGYHVLVRGYRDGELIEEPERVCSVSRALVASSQWDQVLALARSPDLKYIVSNTTESGYVLDPADRLDSAPPATFPGKLTRVLWERFSVGGSPVVLLPCELIEDNGDRLRELVLKQAGHWGLPEKFGQWLKSECWWLNSLVDCIITSPPADHPLLPRDPGLVCAEPYALWALKPTGRPAPPLFSNPFLHVVADLAPFFLRKVRILNGLHTAMVGKFSHAGFETVQQVLKDREGWRWCRGLVYEEIVPTLAYRVDDVAAFADEVFDRFRNPYLSHKLSDIALNHADKVKIRLEPTRQEYERLFGRPPRRLVEAMS